MNGQEQPVAMLRKAAIDDGASLNVYDVCKRVLDIVLTLLLSPLILPLGMLLAILIKLDSRGPVFFITQVIGKDRKPFTYFKFRTMTEDTDRAAHREYVERNVREQAHAAIDEFGNKIYKSSAMSPGHVTRVGKYLRRLSLDELPQFWNVLRGEMSIVGPRPSPHYEYELYNEEQRKRYDVLPGITGLYQVRARNRVPIAGMISIDIDYIDRRSIALDVWIMLLTPFVMLRGI